METEGAEQWGPAEGVTPVLVITIARRERAFDVDSIIEISMLKGGVEIGGRGRSSI